ncbi:MAG: hypothetical protein WBM40_07155 [Thiohalocapsa sp.]
MPNLCPQIALAIGLWCILGVSVADDGRRRLLDGGELSGKVGAAVNTTLDQNGPDAGLAWGFIEATATTPRWHGLGAGATGLGIVDLWNEQPGDFEQVFTVPTDLREFYIDLDSDNGQLSATLGRRAFPANPVLDGDSQQGVGISLPLNLSPNRGATIHVAALNHWIKYSETGYEARGITGWQNVDEANDGAGSVFLTAQVANLAVGRRLKASPFIDWQQGVMAVVGSTFDLSLELPPARGERRWSSELILAYHHNLVPTQIEPEYEDVWSGRLHTGLVGERFSAGGGVYWLGNGRIDLTAGLFDIFDPLVEDNLYPLNDLNNAYEFYLNGSARLGQLTLSPAIGIGRNNAVGADSLEIDLLFDLTISKQLSLSGYAVYVDFSEPVDYNYYKLGTALSLSF